MKAKHFLLSAFALMSVSMAFSQNQPASPKRTATGKVGDATVTVDYSSPSVKGRKIWGGLVPYDSVWRAGANQATIFTTDKDLMVQGHKLPAGKYSLYAVPGQKSWQIIFNSQTGQWGINRDGSSTRKPENDVVVATVKPRKGTMSESLTYVVDKKNLVLKWENLEVPVSLK